MELGVRMKRRAKVDSCYFTDLFEGFEKNEAVSRLFGPNALDTLRMVRITISPRNGYLRVDNNTGGIIICAPYLQTADKRYIYLDLIHELVHVKQFHDGRDLFDRRFSYVDRPTEIEAYRISVGEARRIGMTDSELIDYLKVEWVDETDFRRLLKSVSVKFPEKAGTNPRRAKMI